jgi:hypothetical protein|nr:MAG TPA: hypothetical protein [Caudoviricetes sp.]
MGEYNKDIEVDYVKLEDGMLQYAPINGYGYSNFNQSVELMEKYGYKPFYPTEKPEGGYGTYNYHYEDKGDRIEQVWTFTPYTKEDVRQFRSEDYKNMTDNLCSEYTRKSILGTLTEERKLEIEEQLDMISKYINERYPYPEETNNE